MTIFEEVTVDHIVQNASYYRRLLANESILVFKQLNLSQPDPNVLDREGPDHLRLMWSFHCDYDFMKETPAGYKPWYERTDFCDVMSRADPVGTITGQYHSFLLERLPEEQPEVVGIDDIVGNWHKDHYHYPTPTSLIAMNMHTFQCSPSNGNTVIVNLADAYDDCPKHILDYLRDKSFIYTDVCRCEDPPLSAEHPTFSTHPVTARTSLCYPGRDGGGGLACVPSDGSVKQWQEYEDWIWDYMNAPENQFRMQWEEGDFLIWDNRSCIHNYFGGWKKEDRIFDRFSIGINTPFYNGLDEPYYEPEILGRLPCHKE